MTKLGPPAPQAAGAQAGEQGSSRAGSWLGERRLRLTLWIAAAEGTSVPLPSSALVGGPRACPDRGWLLAVSGSAQPLGDGAPAQLELRDLAAARPARAARVCDRHSSRGRCARLPRRRAPVSADAFRRARRRCVLRRRAVVGGWRHQHARLASRCAAAPRQVPAGPGVGEATCPGRAARLAEPVAHPGRSVCALQGADTVQARRATEVLGRTGIDEERVSWR